MSLSQIPPEQLEPEFLAEDIGDRLVNTSIAFIVVVTAFLILYIASKFKKGQERNIEVWLLMPAAYILCVGSCVMGILYVTIGGAGRHQTYHLVNDPKVMITYAKISVASGSNYGVAITLPKLAIIMTYLKIFVDKWTRRITYLTAVIIICNGITIVVGITTICQPLAFLWDRTIPGGKCGDMLAAFRYVSVPNIITDLVILILPMPTLFKLQISTIKKLGLAMIFLTGSLGIITAILRLYTYIAVDLFSDRTFNGVQNTIWTIIEPCAYFMCACMPGMRPIIQSAYDGSLASSVMGRIRMLTSSRGSRGSSKGVSTKASAESLELNNYEVRT